MERPYIFIPKNKIGKNEFERKVYLNAKKPDVEKMTLLEKLMIAVNPKWAELILDTVGKKIDDWEDQTYDNLTKKVGTGAERLHIEKIEPLEKKIDVFFDILQKNFKAAGYYPRRCGWAASISIKTFTRLGYKAQVMALKVSDSEWPFYHYFIEITDKATGITWIFDPSAEQFKKSPFRTQYLSSRYEKKS